MKHLFIPYELALLAKEKGFNEPCFGYYNDYLNKPVLKIKSTEGTHYFDQLCIAPLYQQIIEWFREKNKLYIEIRRNYDGWNFNITEFSSGNKYVKGSANETEDYYQELNKAIEEAFKLI